MFGRLNPSRSRLYKDLLPEKHQAPDHNHIDQGHKDGGRAEVLGAAAERMVFVADAVHRGLNAAIQQFGDKNQKNAAAKQCLRHAAFAYPQTDRQQDCCHDQLLAKSLLMP